jgi:hypothetical protein
LLSVSATYTLPDDESTAISVGPDNCPTPLPNSLQLKILENSWEYANGKIYNDEEERRVIEIRNSIDALMD